MRRLIAVLAAFAGTLFSIVALFLAPTNARADTVLSNCTTLGLQGALNAGGLISFSCPPGVTTILLSDELISGAPSATLDGGGIITLDSQDTNRTLRVVSGTAVTLTNITLRRGIPSMSSVGGGVYVAPNGALTVDGATIRESRAVSGGGVYVDSGGSLTLVSGSFISNSATTGAGLFVNGNQQIVNTTFLSNTASMSGGGSHISGTVTVSGSRYLSNTSSGSGGGFSSMTTTVTNSVFISNVAAVGGGFAQHFGVQSSVNGSIFTSNKASAGGGFYASNRAAVLGSSFTNNYAIQGGGFTASGLVTVSASSFISNFGSAEGGGFLSGNKATVTDSVFLRNDSDDTGGGFKASSVSVSGSLIMSNTAPYGAGFCCGTMTVQGSTFIENIAGLSGGAFTGSGPVQVTASGFYGNVAPHAAGFQSFNGGSVTNSTFSNNRAMTASAAISATLGPITLTNSTLYSNTSPAGSMSRITLTLQDSIIAGPPGSFCTNLNAATHLGRNIVPNTSCGIGPNLIQLDPLLAPLADNGGPSPTHALLPGSPAIGQSGGCPATDQRGVTRTLPCDLGSYESGAGPMITALSPSSVTAGNGDLLLTVTGSGFLSGSIALWNGSPRPTQVLNATTLLVTISAADLAVDGTADIHARYGAGVDSASNTLPFTIIPGTPPPATIHGFGLPVAFIQREL